MKENDKRLKNLKPFAKGVDKRRNVKGAPKKLPSLEKLLAEVLGEEKSGKTAAETILIALQKRAAQGDVKAADLLLNRAYGKPKETIDLTQKAEFDLSKLSDDELIVFAQLQEKLSKK